MSRIGFLVILLSWCQAGARARADAQLSKDDLLSMVEASRSLAACFSVSYRFEARHEVPQSFTWRNHYRIVAADPRILIENEYGAAKEHSPKLFRTERAFNGMLTTSHLVHVGRAILQSGRDRGTDPKGSGWFDFMLWCPARTTDGLADESLVELLGSRYTRLRNTTENVMGRQCYVLDAIGAHGDKPEATIWLDPARGCLPIRQVFYVRPQMSKVLMEYRIDEAVEVRPSLWMAVRGYKVVYPVIAMVPQLCDYELTVDKDKSGAWQIAVLNSVGDDVFDLWKKLPPGTALFDRDHGKMALVGGGDYQGLAREMDFAMKQHKLEIESSGGPGSPIGSRPLSLVSRRSAPLTIAVSATGLIGAAIAGWWFYRRARSRPG